MNRSFDNPDHWRQRAAEMRRLSEDMRDLIAKATMLEISDQYDRLALRLNGACAIRSQPPDGPEAPTRPADDARQHARPSGKSLDPLSNRKLHEHVI